MIYPIVIYGSQTLRNPSENIAPDYPDLEKLVEDMFLTLGEADGVGLAAPQIGKNIRLFVVDCTPWGEDHPELADYRRAFINAEIYERSEETSLFNEGCLSLPGLHEDVRVRLDPDALRRRKVRGTRRGVHRTARPRDPARIRPHRRKGLHRPAFAAAP